MGSILFIIEEHYRVYLFYMTYVYMAVFILEYVLLFYALQQPIHPNFNLVNHDSTCLLIPFGGGSWQKATSHPPGSHGRRPDHPPKAIFLLQNGLL